MHADAPVHRSTSRATQQVEPEQPKTAAKLRHWVVQQPTYLAALEQAAHASRWAGSVWGSHVRRSEGANSRRKHSAE